jgi:Kef-type K+ transport system membrane component KefB
VKTILGLILIAFLALFGSRSVERTFHIPDAFRRLFTGGVGYLLLGVVLGPSVLGFINDQVLLELSPVVTVGLYWIGFLFGINLKIKDLRRVQTSVYALTAGQSLITFLGVLLVAYLMLRGFSARIGMEAVVAASLTLAACAAGTSQGPMIRMAKDRRFRGPTAQVATVASTLDDFPGIIAIGLLTIFWHRSGPGLTTLPGVAWFGIAIFIGLAGGWVIRAIMERAESEQSRLALVLGAMALGGGITAYLHLSPIFVGVLSGLVYVNGTVRDDRVFLTVARSESTLYVLFLLLAGSMLHMQIEGVFVLTIVMLLVRTFGKTIGGMLFAPRVPAGPGPSHLVGLAMLAQGGLAIALAIQYRSFYPSPISDLIVSVVVIGVVINELVATPIAIRVAQRERT